MNDPPKMVHRSTEARGSYRLFAPVLIDGENLLIVKLTILRTQDGFKLVDNKESDISLHDHVIVKREKLKEPLVQPQNPGENQNPTGRLPSSYNINILDMLRGVKDIKGVHYLDEKDNPNFKFELDTNSFVPAKDRVDKKKKQTGFG